MRRLSSRWKRLFRVFKLTWRRCLAGWRRGTTAVIIQVSSLVPSVNAGGMLGYWGGVKLYHLVCSCPPKKSELSVQHKCPCQLLREIPSRRVGQQMAGRKCQGRRQNMPVGRSKSVPPEVIGQRRCPRQLFGRSVTEAGWQQAGRMSRIAPGHAGVQWRPGSGPRPVSGHSPVWSCL